MNVQVQISSNINVCFIGFDLYSRESMSHFLYLLLLESTRIIRIYFGKWKEYFTMIFEKI